MQPYFAKASIGTGLEPVLNWFQSTALATRLQLLQLLGCSPVVSAVDWNQFNAVSNPVPIETFAKYGRIDHLWVINQLKRQ